MNLSIIISFFVLLAVSNGCGKKDDNQHIQNAEKDEKKSTQSETENRVVPTETQGTPQPQVNIRDSEQFILNQNYFGEVLTLIYPHPRNWGRISIKGDDAKALYDTLQIKSVNSGGNSVWLPANHKEGYNIICFEQARRESPNKPEYACSIYIDYRNGSVSENVTKIIFDEDVPENKSSYLGKCLTMIAPNAVKWGYISINGIDAKALYSTLNVQPVKGEENRKKGENIVCFERSPLIVKEKVEYACSLYINYSDGKVDPIIY